MSDKHRDKQTNTDTAQDNSAAGAAVPLVSNAISATRTEADMRSCGLASQTDVADIPGPSSITTSTLHTYCDLVT